MVKLIIEDEDGRRTTVPVVRSEITIGRRQGNTVRLTERNVSRVHARILQRDGRIEVEDLSRYGTKCNGRRIDGSMELHDGDELVIGEYRLTLVGEATDVVPPQALEDITTTPAPPRMPSDDIDEPARLAILRGGERGKTYAIALHRETVLGRSPDADVRVDHVSISKRHARFLPQDGSLLVEDLGSSNGLQLNGKTVHSARLHQGDKLQIGDIVFQYLPPGATFVLSSIEPEREERDLAPLPAAKPWGIAVASAAGGALVVLLLFGGYLLLKPGAPPADPSAGETAAASLPTSTTATPPATPAQAPPAGLSTHQEQLQRGQLALQEARWQDALLALESALRGFESEGDNLNAEVAASLRERAQNERGNQETYESIRRLADHGAYEDALAQIAELPSGTYYRTRLNDENLERRILDLFVQDLIEASDAAAQRGNFAQAREALRPIVPYDPDHPRLREQSERIDALESAARGRTQAAAVHAAPAPQPTAQRPTAPADSPAPQRVALAPQPSRGQPEVQHSAPPAPSPAEAPMSAADRQARVTELRREAGRLAAQERNFAAAAALLEEAAQLNPRDAGIQFSLYNNYRQLGRHAQAARAAQNHLRLAPPSDPPTARQTELLDYIQEHGR